MMVQNFWNFDSLKDIQKCEIIWAYKDYCGYFVDTF